MTEIKKTPAQKRARSAELKRAWRKANPEAQRAIMERFWAKKVSQIAVNSGTKV